MSKKSFIHPSFRAELRRQRSVIFGSKRYLFHLLFWLLSGAVVAYQVAELISGLEAGMKVSIQMEKTVKHFNVYDIWNYIFGIGIGALLVYIFLLLIIPYARYKQKKRFLYLGFVFIVFIWILGVLFAGFWSGYSSEKGGLGDGVRFGLSLGVTASFSFIIAFAFFSFYYFIDLYDQQKDLNRYEEIFTQKTIAETNFLKTQINPHFLFNTLNNIYALSLQQSERATLITRQLRELCAYMLEECNKDMVSLEGEINFLKSYISLEKLRNRDENVDIDLDIDVAGKGKEIAPLLLLNFVENAFKHGVKAGVDKATVFIRLYLLDNVLSFEMRNSKPIMKDKPSNKSIRHSGGIGLQNVKRRLTLLYPQKHKLRISESELEYSVYLNITLS